MNIAVVFAGGVGTRMNSKERPKQFLEIYGKPIIVHTLEVFEHSMLIDAIVVSCVVGWIPYLKELLLKYNISKVKDVVSGGSTGQISIYNGLLSAAKLSSSQDSIVLIHDAVRPLIDEELLKKNIETVKQKGAAITVGVVKETPILINEDGAVLDVLNRNNSRVAKAPQSFFLKDIIKVHRKAITDGICDFTDSCTMMQYYGYKLYMVDGPQNNIKITTLEDYFTMRAISESKENLQFYIE